MKIIRVTTLSTVSVIAFFSCKKEKVADPISLLAAPAANVYVLVSENGSLSYWKNDSVINLAVNAPYDYFSSGSALTVSGNNIYVAGSETGPTGGVLNPTPIFWQNGTVNPLIAPSGSGVANAVAVDGSDVYLAGISEYNSDTSHVPYTTQDASYPTFGNVATLWKNGAASPLADFNFVGMVGGTYATQVYNDYVTGLYVSSGDVYVAGGSYFENAHACYWKNGNRVDLDGNLNYMSSDGTYGFPNTTGIFETGGNVYVSGFQSTTFAQTLALYWENGNPVFLSTDSISGSMANSVFVTGGPGGIVYVAGWLNDNTGYSRATLWKNGYPIELTHGDTASVAYSVCVTGTDVYVSGQVWVAGGHYIATYWKNGVPTYLTNGTDNAIAYSISAQ
jgi:hypothetical protein